MTYNKIYAVIGEERHIVLDPINYQYDVKQILVISGETVPDYYEADVCNVGDTATLTMVGTAADGVEIPDKFLLDGRNVLVYVVIPGSGGDVQTRYDITIPVDERAEREDIDPSEAEQQQIDSLINALNSGVGRAEEAATTAAESATDAEGSAGEAEDQAENAEAWAVGQRAGEDVPDTDPTYHNNSKYYAGMAEAAAEEAGQHEASWETWVQRAESAADDAERSARAAAGAKADAEAAAQTATQKATEAGNSAAAASSSAASARQTVDGAIGAINTARDGALTAIGSAGSNAVGAVEQAGTTQTGRVTSEGNTQVNRVQAKGDEVLDSIPQDYSDLVDDVADLTRQLSDVSEETAYGSNELVTTADFKNASTTKVTYSYDSTTDSVTVTGTPNVPAYGDLHTGNILSLTAGKTYKFHAVGVNVSGTPAMKISVRGKQGNKDGVVLTLNGEGDLSGEFVATGYEKYCSIFMAASSQVTTASKCVYSQIWLKEIKDSAVDLVARHDLDVFGYETKSAFEITDFNDVTEQGVYPLYSKVYANSPLSSATSAVLIVIRPYDQSLTFRVQLFWDFLGGKTYMRRRTGYPGTWGAWNLYPLNDKMPNLYSYSIGALVSQGNNVGTPIKVMSYNICNYNNDTETFATDEKLYNLRKLLNDTDADFIGTQEDRANVNSAGTKSALGYLFNPVYPNAVLSGDSRPAIRSKESATANGMVEYSNGRWIEYATYSVGNGTLLMLSTHPVANYNSSGESSDATIEARATQYTELFQWANGDITLNDSNSNPVSVPNHDWCVICGDFNCITATDKTNLLAAAQSKNFIAANGGKTGWLITAPRYTADKSVLDGIFVSSNVIINTFESLTDLYDSLYSDHVPIIANLTLLEVT